MNAEINKFIEQLTTVKSNSNFFNQYSYDVSVNSIRRNNLFLYLQQMVNLKPRMLFVGEAPGYRGCRLTGVPFTSEYILLNGLEQLSLFGESRGYRKTDEFEKLWKEATASIFWESVVKTLHIPLLWNAFPYHPFQMENEQSNRQPTKIEISTGQEFLKELIRLFDIEIVVAVGNTAETTLKSMGIACQKVRHPSFCGKIMFINGINDVINSLS
jgi:uracil-DNA glycosylase